MLLSGQGTKSKITVTLKLDHLFFLLFFFLFATLCKVKFRHTFPSEITVRFVIIVKVE